MAAQGISAEEIKQLLTCYAIGKKPLARLLGWGETTILYYAKNGCPEGEFANRLRRLAAEPEYFLTLLEQGKESLTPVAYKKSRAAVRNTLQPSKEEAAARYLIARAKADVSPFRVVMTLYYTQAITLALKKEPFLTEECDLSETGEIPYAGLYEKIRQGIAGMFSEQCAEAVEKKSGKPRIGAEKQSDVPMKRTVFAYLGKELLTSEEEIFLGEIYDILAWYGPEELKKIFASERPYLKKSNAENGKKIIRHTVLASYYKKVVQGYKISSPTDFNNYFSERAGRKKYRKGQNGTV